MDRCRGVCVRQRYPLEDMRFDSGRTKRRGCENGGREEVEGVAKAVTKRGPCKELLLKERTDVRRGCVEDEERREEMHGAASCRGAIE